MVSDLVFYFGIALLITHELDAIAHHEWRMFPLICRLKDNIGYQVFIILHIPLLVLMFWFTVHSSESIRYIFQVGMDIFFILHLGFHYLFQSHPENELTGTFSNSLIVLTSMTGVVHLLLLTFS